jgi:hypothetical protein
MFPRPPVLLLALALALSAWGLAPAHRAWAATCTSNVTTGNWSANGTWTACGGGIPQNGDDVVIATGHTITVDTNTNSLASLTVDGTLTVGNDATARSVTVTGNVTVASGGTCAAGSTAATHTLLIGGNLSNDGTFDGLPGAGRIINVTFNGSANQTVSGTGSTTRFNTITVNNSGAASNNIVEVASTNFTASSAFLTLTDGVLKMSGSFTFSNTFFSPAGYTINAHAGLWLNNLNVTVTGQNGTPTLAGSIRVTSGTYNVGTSTGNSLTYDGLFASFTMEGGSCNIAGRFDPQGGGGDEIDFSMSGGTLTVATVGHIAADASFDIQDVDSTFTMSGGTIVLQSQSTAGTPADYRNVAGTVSITGGTVQFGNAFTSGSPSFEVVGASTFPSLAINATGTPSVRIASGITVNGNMTVDAGSTFDANGNSVTVSGILENDGTLRQTLAVNGTGAVNFFNTGSYGGAVLDAAGGGDLGSTLVIIRGNQACDTANSMIRRCYDIQPTNTSGRSATVQLAYYTTPDNEENSQTCSSLEMYRWNGTTWEVAGTTPTRSCGGTTRTIQKVGVTSFSPFGLADAPAGPLAITLLRLTAVPAGPPSLPLAAFPLAMLVGLSGLGLMRRRAPR